MKSLFAFAAILAFAVGCSEPSQADLYAEDTGDDHHHHDHGPLSELGKLTLLDKEWTVSMSGEFKAGSELHISVDGYDGQGVDAAHAWIGKEDGIGAEKGALHAHGNHVDAHVPVPDPLPADAKLWFSVALEGGETAILSLDLPKS